LNVAALLEFQQISAVPQNRTLRQAFQDALRRAINLLRTVPESRGKPGR